MLNVVEKVAPTRKNRSSSNLVEISKAFDCAGKMQSKDSQGLHGLDTQETMSNMESYTVSDGLAKGLNHEADLDFMTTRYVRTLKQSPFIKSSSFNGKKKGLSILERR